MATKFVDFERSKLHDQVWGMPLTKVAELYAVRAQEVKRIAIQLAVPLPPQGHWTKVALGKALATPALPAFEGATSYRRSWWVNDETEEVNRRFDGVKSPQAMGAHELPELKSQISDCLPLIRRMASRLRKSHKDTRNWPTVSMMGHFEISVAPTNQDRALLTLDRALRTCQNAGFKLVSDESKRDPAYLVVEGVAFTMRIFESGRREERVLTKEEKDERRARPSSYQYIHDRFVFHPTNILKLEVFRAEYRVIELTLQDGPQAPLAECLQPLVPRLLEAALKHKLREQVRAEERQRAEERRVAHQRLIDAKRAQLEKLKHYEALADQFERARRLRGLAEALDASKTMSDESGQAKLVWIRNAADWLDPTVEKHWPEVDDVHDQAAKDHL